MLTNCGIPHWPTLSNALLAVPLVNEPFDNKGPKVFQQYPKCLPLRLQFDVARRNYFWFGRTTLQIRGGTVRGGLCDINPTITQQFQKLPTMGQLCYLGVGKNKRLSQKHSVARNHSH